MLQYKRPEYEDEMECCAAQHEYIYDHGILLPPSTRDPTIIAPALFFNAALAHHLSAAASYTSSPEELQKVKRLYELAYGSQGASAHNPLIHPLYHHVVAAISSAFFPSADMRLVTRGGRCQSSGSTHEFYPGLGDGRKNRFGASRLLHSGWPDGLGWRPSSETHQSLHGRGHK